MLKIWLRSPAALSAHGEAYGFGRLYRSLKETLPRMGAFLCDSQQADLQVCITLPFKQWKYYYWWARERHKVQVIYTVWEVTRLLEDAVEVLNSVSAVFVPSTFCEQVFKESGVKVPIYVVPHGVDPERFAYLERSWHDEFVFLWQGMSLYDRKGFQYVKEAWKKLGFDRKNDVLLIAKIYPTSTPRNIPILHDKENNLTIIQCFLSHENYLNLMRRCHAGIYPFRSEGFGLMPLESAATGMAVALTNWSGSTDYIQEGLFWPIDYQLSAPGEDFLSTSPFVLDFKVQGARDAIPKVDSICDAMKWMYENRNEAKAMGMKASKYVRTHWTWEKAALHFLRACEQVLLNA